MRLLRKDGCALHGFRLLIFVVLADADRVMRVVHLGDEVR